MPSVSKRQAKLLLLAAHTKGGYGGVPQKVGEDFNAADEAHSGKRKRGMAKIVKRRAKQMGY